LEVGDFLSKPLTGFGSGKSEETGIVLFNLERKLGETSEQGLETAPLFTFSAPPDLILIETSIY
jgi:hypothetical protein